MVFGYNFHSIRIHFEIFRSAVHVRHWVQWAVRQFNLTNIKLSDWSMTGQELHSLTIQDFQKIVPNDPGDVFWTHLELLRKMKVVGRYQANKICMYLYGSIILATKREEAPKRVPAKIMRPKVSFG